MHRGLFIIVMLASISLSRIGVGTYAEEQTGKPAHEFVADFDADHDFLSRGVGDTGWDGLVGQGARETVDRMAAAGGKLHLQSTGGRYQEGWNPLGPLLYRIVTGDFKATVRVVDYQGVSYNNGGIMARAANLDDAGKGEDWISVDYFPIYGGIYGRMADDGRRTEKVNNGQGRGADKHLQLERVGHLFFLRHSADGVTWKDLPGTPIQRLDLVNVPLQVGLFQATYSRNQGEVTFDEFSLVTGAQVNTARIHSPEDDARNTPTAMTLSWIPGSGARQHDVYFGAYRQSVETAHHTLPTGTNVYRGRQEVRDIDYEVAGLRDGATYYWRIDEVADGQIHRGQVWSFSTYDRDLEDFEGHGSTDELLSAWTAGATAALTLSTAGGHKGRQSLKLDYDNSRAPYHARVEFAFDTDQDWRSSFYSFRSLRVFFKGDPGNQSGKLYMFFEDDDWGTNRSVVEYTGDPASLLKPVWSRWDIDLEEVVANNPAFRLGHVKKIGLAIGHPDSAGEGTSGTVYFDAISIQYEQRSGRDDAWPKYVHPERFVQAVPFHRIAVTGGLWRERMDVNRKVSLPHVWGRCEASTKGNGEDSRRLDNFRKAAGEMPGGFTGTYFNDSDVYKIIEGTANSLRDHPDPALEAYTDRVIDSIAGAQWDDGYLYTFYSLPRRTPSRRWSNVGSMHELYCAGHLIEGAIAYHEATGKRKLLDAAIKCADNICETFGPGKKLAAPGHQEIELALMKLHRTTGKQRYMDTARFFIDQRGNGEGRDLYGTYSQDHIPFIEQEKGVGHSVRAGYMYCSATDIAMLTHDEAYANALFRLWDNITSTKTYITGGVGQPGGPEGFANDYELGNNCYAETCSGIAFALWNHRLHQMTGESKYIDVMERTFLNNMLSSLSARGDKHFYTNPLTTNGRARWEWPGHDCACCPSNLVRVISSIGGTIYSHNDHSINVNVYVQSKGTVPLSNQPVTLSQTTRYPWDGDVKIAVDPGNPRTFAIKLRIPGWARSLPMPGNLYRYLEGSDEQITVAVNDSPVNVSIQNGYVTLERQWRAGDTVHLVLPMPIRRVVAHPKATADAGLVAIERGPIVYCAEFRDHPFDVASLKLPDSARLTATFEEDFFGGVVTLTSDGDPRLKLIPYYLYANRGKGWMRVWMSRG